MSASDTLENEILLHLLQNAEIALIGDATGLRGSSTAGSLYVGLHTSDPGEAGNQSSNECAYTSYARVAVARTSGGWTVTADVGTNAADITFPKATGGTETATHFSIGTASSGTGKLLFKGALASSLAISNNVRPKIEAGTLTITAS